jgi:hypothetical protein
MQRVKEWKEKKNIEQVTQINNNISKIALNING